MSGIHAGNTRIEYDTIDCTAFLVVDPIVHPTKNIVTILIAPSNSTSGRLV